VKKFLAVLWVLALFATITGASQQEAIRQLMKAKAGYAHRLLDAIVMEDFDAVREQSFRLKAVAETADWKVLDTPEYVRESDAFIRATERLVEAARNRSGDSAALAYMDVTLRCVHCHRYLREHAAGKP
jgi:hypothetical protein